MPVEAVESVERRDRGGISRRTLLRVGAVGVAGAALGTGRAVGAPYLKQKGLLSADGAFAAETW